MAVWLLFRCGSQSRDLIYGFSEQPSWELSRVIRSNFFTYQLDCSSDAGHNSLEVRRKRSLRKMEIDPRVVWKRHRRDVGTWIKLAESVLKCRVCTEREMLAVVSWGGGGGSGGVGRGGGGWGEVSGRVEEGVLLARKFVKCESLKFPLKSILLPVMSHSRDKFKNSYIVPGMWECIRNVD